MALVSKTFSQIITFTRASTATYFDSSGVLQSAAINTPRFDYDPSTLAARGFLIEEQRTNLLTYSEEFDDAAWAKTGLNTTGTPPWIDVAVAPDGNTTADKLTEDTSTGEHATNQTFSFTAGTTYTMSIFAKAAERTLIRVGAGNPLTWNAGVIVDLTTGTITSTIGGTGSVQDVGNGWYRISVTGAALLTANTGRSIRLISTGTTFSYTGDGTSGLYVWGAQFEVGAFATSYIPTTTTALTRSADVAAVNTLSPWYNASEGTWYAEWNTPASSVSRYMFSAQQVLSSGNRFDININASNIVNPRTLVGGSVIATLAGGTYTAATTAKVGFSYKTADYKSSLNGAAAVLVTTAGALPSPDIVYLGSLNGSSNFVNGHLRRFTFYPRAFSAAELPVITA